MQYDYIIVGQGIAGTTLAYELIRKGKKVLVINEAVNNASSMVAAGIYNPITGRKMVKTWKADLLFPYLEVFYQNQQKEIGARFLHKMNIYRPFLSVEEQNEWMGKSAGEEYKDYVREVYKRSGFGEFVFDDFGGLLLSYCGYLDIPVYLESMRNYLINLEAYEEAKFDEHQLELLKDSVNYKGKKAKKIIFCTGKDTHNSTFFSWLPFSLVKGEILFIKTSERIDEIFNRGVFVLPTGESTYCKVGATYDNHDLSLKTTDSAREKLEIQLKKLLKTTYEVVGQVAGIRPATRDRRPFIGIHPKYEQVGIFNGFGTKGVSLVPFFADQFVGFLENGTNLDPEVNINRYFSLS